MPVPPGELRVKVAFLGGARYSRPLDQTNEKKFRLLMEGGEIFVIGFSQTGRPRRFTQHACFYLLPQFRTPVLRYAAMSLIGPLLALWLIWRRGVRILVAQSPYEGLAAGLAKKAARCFRRKVVLIVESHGDFEESLFMQRRILVPGLYRFLMRHVAGFTLKHADVLRSVSHSTRAQLERWVPGKPLIQFPAWTDIEVFVEAGAIKGCSTGEKIILYVGVLTPLKGVHFLIDAFAKVTGEFPDVRLEIIGKAENTEYTHKLQEQAKQLKLDGRVMFLNTVSQQELAKHLTRARVVVLPSLSEGLPRVVLEAMACGTPVIGTRVGGIVEMIVDGDTGFLVPPGDEAVLAERLRWALTYPVEAEVMGRRAREFALRFFSSEAYAQSYAWIFKISQRLLEKGT